MEKKVVKVSAAVIVSESRILAAQRMSGEYAGCWEFPGGKHEKGETARQALKREISEELGILISTGQHICTASSVRSWKEFRNQKKDRRLNGCFLTSFHV